MLSRDEVLKIARLARLELTSEEVETYRTRLGRVLEHIRELNALETPKDAFVRHIPKDAVALREDMPIPFADTASLLKNAPDQESSHFLLPPVMEGN